MKKRFAKWTLLFSSVLCVNIVSAQTTLLSSGTTSPLTDGQVLLSSNSLKPAKDIYFPFSAKAGAEYDVIRGVLNLENVAGGTVSQANAVAGYAYCNVITGAYPAAGNCSGLLGFAVAAKTGGAAWGIQTACQVTALGPTNCIGGELDVGITVSGTGSMTGLLLATQGGGRTSGAVLGVDLEKAPNAQQFSFGVNCGNGAIGIACILAGTASVTPTPRVSSQAFAWQYFNDASTGVAMTMAAAGTGGFTFSTTDTLIATAMDWSKITIANCVLELVAGCVLSGAGAFIAVAATPATPPGAVGYGATVVVPGANNCPVFAGGKRVDGCSVINVAGSYKVMPYFEWVSP
jgi:hypothetical protein